MEQQTGGIDIGVSEPGNGRFTIGGLGPSSGSGRPSATDASGTEDQTQTSPPVPPRVTRSKQRKKADLKAAAASSDMVLGVAESLLINRYGIEAKILPPERKMMDNGLTALFTNLPVETVERVASMSAPFMGVIGLMFYLQRIAALERRRRDTVREAVAVNAAEAVRQAENIVNPQGTNGTVESVSNTPSKDELFDLFNGGN